jgi:hypothetical protein
MFRSLDEKLTAIRFDKPNKHFNEIYQIVENSDGTNPRLEVINYAFSEKKLKEATPDLIEDYGSFIELGSTYGYLPYIIGTKRVAKYMIRESRKKLNALFTKENQIEILINQCDDSEQELNKLAKIIDQINGTPDDVYDFWARTQVSLTLKDVVSTITYQEAYSIFQDFLKMNPTQENTIKENYIKNTLRDRNIFKHTNLKFDN